MDHADIPAFSALPPVGWGQELNCLLDLAKDQELGSPLPDHEPSHELHHRRSLPDSTVIKEHTHRQVAAGVSTRKFYSLWSSDGEGSVSARPSTVPESSFCVRRLQSREGPWSSRGPLVLKPPTASSAAESTNVNDASSSMDPATPDSCLRGVHTAGSVGQQSDTPFGARLPPLALDSSLWSQQSFSPEDLASSPASQQSFKSWEVSAHAKYSTPVLFAKSIESSLSKPGAPPRTLCKRTMLTLETMKPEEPPISPRKAAVPTQKVRPPALTEASLTEASLSALSGTWFSDTGFSEERSDAQSVKAPSQTSLVEAAQIRGSMSKCNIIRSTLDRDLVQLDKERMELACWRREATKVAEKQGLQRLARFKASRKRGQSIFRLQALVNNPEVRRSFEVGKNHQPKSKPRGTPTPTFQQTRMDKPLDVNHDVKMPAQVNWRHAIDPPKDLEADAQEGNEKQKALEAKRFKQPGSARLRNLRRQASAKINLANEMSVPADLRNNNVAESAKQGEPGSPTHGPSTDPDAPRPLLATFARASKEILMAELPIEVQDSILVKRSQALAAEHHRREMNLLRHAFDKQDGDRSRTLDLAELRTCLVSIGLAGKNATERQAVRRILWSMDSLEVSFPQFSETVLVQVRETLHTLRRPWIEQLFKSFDSYGTNCLSIADALNGLRRLGTPMREELRAEVTDAFIFQTLEDQVPLSLNEPCLDIDAFVKFVGILHEFADRDRYLQFQSILQKYSIGSQVEAQWQHDLVELHSQFHEYDPVSGKYGSSTGSLSEKQAMTVMRESGYMPKSELRQQKTVEMVEEATRVEGTLGFMEFLNIMYKLREYDRERLRRLFETRNNWAHGTLTLADIYEVLPMAGLIPRSNDEKHEVTAIIEEFDEDGLGIVSCDECLTVLQMLDRKFRLMQRERERQYVISAGWSESNFAEFREAFWSFDEDMSEVLERDELMKAVEMLRGSFWQSSSNMNLMLVALGIDPTKEIQVNFLMFLRMLKMLDDTESRRQQGLLMGFPQERTDTLYTIFQALEPESDGTVGRELLQQVVLQVLRDLPKIQLDDVTRMLSQEPLQVEFGAFLRLMKSIDGFQEVNFDDCVREMFNLADNANSGVI